MHCLDYICNVIGRCSGQTKVCTNSQAIKLNSLYIIAPSIVSAPAFALMALVKATTFVTCWLVKGNISVIHQWMPLAQVISVIQGSIYIRDTLAGLGINTNAKNHLILSLKLKYSEKTTKIWKKTLNFIWRYLVSSKKLGRLFQIFVAFSEYLNCKIVKQ